MTDPIVTEAGAGLGVVAAAPGEPASGADDAGDEAADVVAGVAAGGASGVSSGVVVGVDIGGTFTDVVVASTVGTIHVHKVLTTPDDPRRGLRSGVAAALAGAGSEPASVTRFVHGTTLATNVILQRQGARVAFVTTAGFGDMVRLGREARVDGERYDLFFEKPVPPVEHELTFEVLERVRADGSALRPLTPVEAVRVASLVAAARPEAVAVCLVNSYANAAHEQAVAEALRAVLPSSVTVAVSSDIWPELREFERAMTTVLSAYVAPVMSAYLNGLSETLQELGITCPVEVIDSAGGVMSASVAASRPVSTLESGGAAGIMAAAHVGRLTGASDLLSFDMGGTTAKAGIVRDGRPAITHDFQVGGSGSYGHRRAGTGLPLKVPTVDLAEVGAGGGSIAWLDGVGALSVGPRSAGAVPGPACYGLGGSDPTVTDANLVLGFLAPEIADGVRLSVDAATVAIDSTLARPLGLAVVAAAWAVHEIINATMAAAIRVVTVQRGIDPRDFTMIGFGGAGPMHIARLADTFGIERVVVPYAAGVAAAVGLVASDPSVVHVQTRVIAADDARARPDAVADLLLALEDRARLDLGVGVDIGVDAGGVGSGGGVVLARTVEMRFVGQAHQLPVDMPGGPVTSQTIEEVTTRFRAGYRQAYGIDLDLPSELVTFRVRVTRPGAGVVAARVEPGPRTRAVPTGTRNAYLAERAVLAPVPVFAWRALRPGDHLPGPALVDGSDTTIVVPAGWSAEVDAWSNVVLERTVGRDGGRRHE